MDGIGLGALAAVEEYACSLDDVALEHRVFGHDWTRHTPEEINDRILRVDFDCTCNIGKTLLVYPDDTYTVSYDYSRVRNYLRRGAGSVFSSKQRGVLRRMALVGR
jgi:hypothetical protein